ncbi:MAG: glycosyltransferase family 39 protein [Ignavibacteria bacterium]|nr:glycosyltransferase family 39 protein [Ignavibacteria bacterium]
MFFTLHSYKKFSDYLNDKRNFYKIFITLLIFLSLLKLPPIFTTDIQPWDEGMYASRVLSIEKFGDVLDQTSHSVGKYYSSTHPPLLIWIGYLASKVTGLNAITLKLVTYTFALLCLLFLMKIGTLIHSAEAGFYAAVIFSSNIIFNIFSKRFQFDIPYTFFVILSFYYFIKYLNEGEKKYIYYTAIAAGLCMLSKLLVGLLIPIVLFASYLFVKKETKFSLKDFIVVIGIALLMSAPWYIYLVVNNGSEAFDYILNFHLYQRAAVGIEQNSKATGVFYFINYILTIIPFGFLVFYSIVINIKNLKKLDWKIKFISLWFIIGFGIVTLFKTKLESYSFLFLPPACLLMADLILRFKNCTNKEKITILSLTALNILWYGSEHYRTNLKEFLSGSLVHKLEVVLLILVFLIIVVFAIRIFISKINLTHLFVSIILITFAASNVYYLVNVPYWENGYKISRIKEIIDKEKDKPIYYIASNYRHNPQLTFYFNGVDLNWGSTVSGYDFTLLDTKNGVDSVKKNLTMLNRQSFIIVEKDNINRAEYPSSELFIPANYVLINKTSGYELYKNF